VDLVVGGGGPWLAACVTAADSHWTLTNLTSARSLLVENLENSFEYLTIGPRRRRAPIPFDLARVGASDSRAESTITVFGPEPKWVGRLRPPPCPVAPPFRVPLDPGSTYYAVLEALFQPRLPRSPVERLPTSEEIVADLRARRIRLSARAVDAHIQYVGDKLGLHRSLGRDVLVMTAIRRGLVPR
jgi:hypothetical protein